MFVIFNDILIFLHILKLLHIPTYFKILIYSTKFIYMITCSNIPAHIPAYSHRFLHNAPYSYIYIFMHIPPYLHIFQCVPADSYMVLNIPTRSLQILCGQKPIRHSAAKTNDHQHVRRYSRRLPHIP